MVSEERLASWKDDYLFMMSLKFELSNSEISKYWSPTKTFADLSDDEKSVRFQEVSDANQKLGRYLSSLGFTSSKEVPIFGRCDFYQNDDVGLCRSIGLEILNRRMIRKDILEKIAEFLNKLPEEYYVLISNDFDDSIEIFLIAVTRRVAYGRFESAELARSFGFDPAEDDIGRIQ